MSSGSAKPLSGSSLALSAVVVAVTLVYVPYAYWACLLPQGHGLRTVFGAPLGGDFVAVFAAIHLPLAALFDQARVFAAERLVEGDPVVPVSWGYPPLFLFYLQPLLMFPYLPALAIWTAATAAPFLILLRRQCGATWPLLAACLPLMQNAICGQNGSLTASLLLGGIIGIDAGRPVLAGILFGLLAYKPQVMVLVPFCLLFGRHYKTLAVCIATAAILCLASVAVFGVDVWIAFLHQLPRQMQYLQNRVISVGRVPTMFALTLVLSNDPALAKAVQGLSTLLAIIAVAWCWHRHRDPWPRLVMLCAAVPLASPYLMDYDLVLWGCPAALLFRRLRQDRAGAADQLALMVTALGPTVIWLVAAHYHAPTGALLVLLLAAYAVMVARRTPQAISSEGAPGAGIG